MDVLSIALLSVALLFTLTTLIAIVLIRRAPTIQEFDPDAIHRSVAIRKRERDNRKRQVRWTQLNKTTQLRETRSEGTNSPGNS